LRFAVRSCNAQNLAGLQLCKSLKSRDYPEKDKKKRRGKKYAIPSTKCRTVGVVNLLQNVNITCLWEEKNIKRFVLLCCS